MRPGSGVRASLTLMPELNLYPRLFPLWFLILSCNYLMSIPGPEVRDPRKVTGKWQKERLGPAPRPASRFQYLAFEPHSVYSDLGSSTGREDQVHFLLGSD